MRINSIQSVNFKAVSIKASTAEKVIKKADLIMKKRNEFAEEMTKSEIITGGEKIAKKINDIDIEMKIRRKVESEKPWYKRTYFEFINKKEADEKTNVTADVNAILKKAISAKNAIIAADKEFIESLSIEDAQSAIDLQTQRKINNIETYKSLFAENKGFLRIAGYNKEKNILNKYFISEINNEKQGLKADVPSSVLFFGPTGNGKTTFAKALADETGCFIEKIRFSKNKKYEDIFNKLKETAEKSEDNFQKNKQRTIIFIDEFDKIADDKSTITKELIDFINSCSEKYHCTVFAATNHPLKLTLPIKGEESVFSYIVSMDPPNLQNKKEILKHYLSERNNNGFDYEKLAELLEKQEQKTGERYNISQIKNDICLIGEDNNIEEEQIINLILNSKPNIVKNSMEKYNNEMKVLMENRIEN